MYISEALFEVFIAVVIDLIPRWTRFDKTGPKSNRSDLPILIHWVRNLAATPVGTGLVDLASPVD